MASKVFYETQTKFGSVEVNIFGYGFNSNLFLYPITEPGVAKVKIYSNSFKEAINFLLGLFKKDSNFELEIRKHINSEFKLEKIKFEFNQVEITLEAKSNQQYVFDAYYAKREEYFEENFVESQPY